jgi:hypothetical protein
MGFNTEFYGCQIKYYFLFNLIHNTLMMITSQLFLLILSEISVCIYSYPYTNTFTDIAFLTSNFATQFRKSHVIKWSQWHLQLNAIIHCCLWIHFHQFSIPFRCNCFNKLSARRAKRNLPITKYNQQFTNTSCNNFPFFLFDCLFYWNQLSCNWLCLCSKYCI